MPKTILIAMDSSLCGAFLVQEIARHTPHFVLFVTTSAEVLELTRDIKPDLFLFDELLPSMTGMQLYQCLHGRKALHHVPVILLTMRENQVEKQHGVGKSTQVYNENFFPIQDFLFRLETVLKTTVVT
jgi:DNA-binding response OmpR family regulator